RSRAPYDRYPENWKQGSPAPNLESFAHEVLASGSISEADCLLVGSRGGQVLLPQLWKALGADVPPTVVINGGCVVINGGCAMRLPEAVAWPRHAVTFLLIGGQDQLFRQGFSPEQYVADVQKRVPRANGTTAILFVEEMLHMPQGALLAAVLPHLLRVGLAWRSSGGQLPLRDVHALLSEMNIEGSSWTGRLLFTSAPGSWQD
ncbi:unnamed protein product, partial [Polarella glacialis]